MEVDVWQGEDRPTERELESMANVECFKESRWQQVQLVKFYGLPGAMTSQDGKKIINK